MSLNRKYHNSFTETIIPENYHTLIMNFISLFEVDEQKQGIKANTANSTMQMICNLFGDCIIPRYLWPSWSLDITPLHFHLWSFLKENENKSNLHTLEEPKQNIQLCIQSVTEQTLQQDVGKMRKSENACIAEHGGHFQHLISRCLFYDINVYFFWQHMFKKWAAWPLITLYAS